MASRPHTTTKTTVNQTVETAEAFSSARIVSFCHQFLSEISSFLKLTVPRVQGPSQTVIIHHQKFCFVKPILRDFLDRSSIDVSISY